MTCPEHRCHCSSRCRKEPIFGVAMLLSLPPELRAMIWGHVFILPEAKAKLKLSPHTANTKSVLRILTVCKTIYKEAMHIFYRYNYLELASPAALFLFLSSLHRFRRTEITALSVAEVGLHYTGFQVALQAFSMLQLCPKLTCFQLDLTTEKSWDILDKVPPHVYEPAWNDFQEGLDCLANLRGLTTASIRGINPESFSLEKRYTVSDLTEVQSCHRADALRKAWVQPAYPRIKRHDLQDVR